MSDDKYLNQLQATLQDMQRVMSERTRATRELGVPHPAVTGYTGDQDMRRFYDPTLQGQILIQSGMNGWQCGQVTLNQAPVIYKPNLPVLTNACGPSVWGQTRLTPGVVPFLSTTAFIPTCGQTPPYYNGGVPPTMQTNDPSNPPTVGNQQPPSWPTS